MVVKRGTRREPADTTGRGREGEEAKEVGQGVGLVLPASMPITSESSSDSSDESSFLYRTGTLDSLVTACARGDRRRIAAESKWAGLRSRAGSCALLARAGLAAHVEKLGVVILMHHGIVAPAIRRLAEEACDDAHRLAARVDLLAREVRD